MTSSKGLQRLLQCSMGSQLFPNLYHYINSTWPVVDRWLHHQNVFSVTQVIGRTSYRRNDLSIKLYPAIVCSTKMQSQ